MSEIFEKVSCLQCGSIDFTSITSVGQFGIITNVALCKECGFMFLSPRWTKERYNDFYMKEYENYYPRQSNEKQQSGKLAELIAERLYSFHDKGSYNKILDIGSGFGGVLMYLKEFHFQLAEYYAIEPSKICIDHLKQNQIHIISETVDNNWHQANIKFDLIIIRHVLEHLLDPKLALNKVAEALTEDGIVYIAVPDAYHPVSPLNSYYFRVVHASYFNRDSIPFFLEAAGLEILELKDNLHGELYLIARKTNNRSRKPTLNIYAKQLGIIESKYAKEKEQKRIPVSGKSLSYFFRKLINQFIHIK